MSGRGSPPPVPGPIAWALARLLNERERRLVLAELAELHAAVAARHGVPEADRRYLRQLRRYPVLLALRRLRTIVRFSGGGDGEIRRAGRALASSPVLSLTIVATLALGIAGCAVVFSMVEALYLSPLPYPDADRVARIYTDAPPNRFPLSVVDFQALEARQTSFEHVGAYRTTSRALAGDAGVELMRVVEATPGLLETWGLTPRWGRTPTRAEGAPDAPATVMVTAGFAERRMDVPTPADAIGRTLMLDDQPWEVIGILPPDLGPLARGSEFVPTLRLQPPTRKGPFFLTVFGRLAAGVEPAAARAELRALNEQLFPLWADSYQDRRATWGLEDVTAYARGDVGPLLGVLMGAVALMLLIAVTNAVNLLLARFGSRAREMAVRRALGASAGRIWWHLAAESAWLAGLGGALGLALAYVGIRALPVVAGDWLPRAADATLGGYTVAFAAGLAGMAALLFAIVPAIHGRKDSHLGADLRSGGRSSTDGRSQQRTQRLLVAGQLAVVTPLLVGTTLLLASFARLQEVEPGYAAEELLMVNVALGPTRYADGGRRADFWEPAISSLAAMPGVAGVTLSSERPPDDVGNVNNFRLEDRPPPAGESEPVAPWITVAPSYFDVLGIPIIDGRGFEAGDLDDGAPPVVVVDEAWARLHYPGESPVGRRLYAGGRTTGPQTTIVGVASTVPYQGVGTSPLGAMYEPTRAGLVNAWLIVRTSGDPGTAAPAVREALRQTDPSVPIVSMATGASLLRDSFIRPRHLSLLLGTFSAVALGLAVIGLYGITAHFVQRRRSDIAVRLALGGAPESVIGRTVWQGLRLTLAGLAVGLLATVPLTGGLSALLYEVEPRDPLALAAAAALLVAVSGVACLVPAVRAVRVDPAEVLREE